MENFPTKILVATDGSRDAALAVRAGVDLFSRTEAELHVVHAWRNLRPATLPAVATDEYSRAYERYEREAAELLETEVERIRESGGTMTRAHLREGRPAEEIVALAEELNADLVVVGSRGLGTVKRLVTGSVSEEVVHLAACPTLVVRGGEGAWPPSRLVIGDDSSGEAKRAGDLAASIGRLFDARALLVRAYPRSLLFPAGAGATGTPDSGETEEALRIGDESLEGRATELEDFLGMRLEVKAAVADAATLIQELAEEGTEPTLVAVGSRGLDAARRFTMGSVSTDLLRAVDGSVLVCPLPEGA